MAETRTIFASYVDKGDCFERHVSVRVDQKPRSFVCTVISEPVLYMDHRHERRVQMMCKTTDRASGRVHVSNMSLPESELLTLVGE